MSETLAVPVSGLPRGPVTRKWHLEEPEVVLGEIPEGVRSVDVSVELRAEGRSGVRARGRLTARGRLACRRCLADVEVAVETDLDVWFRESELVTPGEDRVWELPVGVDEIDLTEAVREELWLAMPDWVVCEEACEGLCPGCGVRVAEEDCHCPPPPPDPRWDALEALRPETDEGDGAPGGAETGEDA